MVYAMLESITAALDSIHPAAENSRSWEQRSSGSGSGPLAEAEQPGAGNASREGIEPRADKAKADGSAKDKFKLSREAQEIRQLQQRDREVRAHEAAHAAAGGAYAGSPRYTYEKGPDGRRYATGGEVSIDISPVRGNPEATLQKAQQVRAAALAPAQPSAQDMKVAQKAQVQAMKARLEISESENEPRSMDGRQAASAQATTDPSRPMGGYRTPSHETSPRGVHEGMAGITKLDIQA